MVSIAVFERRKLNGYTKARVSATNSESHFKQMISNKQVALVSSQEKRMLESIGSGDPFLRIDHQTSTHQVIKLRERASDGFLPVIILSKHYSQSQRVTNMFSLRVVEQVYPHEPALVEKPPSRVRGPLDEPEGDGSNDPLDQRQMQQIIMLRFTSPSHKNSLEEHVADEELEADAADAPEVRFLVPLHAQQHLRGAVLTRVDDAVTPLARVGGAAVVDQREVAAGGQVDALVAVVRPFCGRGGGNTHFPRRRGS